MAKRGSQQNNKAKWRQNTNHKAKYERQRLRTEAKKALRKAKNAGNGV